MKKINKLWGSAFKKDPQESIIKFTAGRDVYPKEASDSKLLKYDLQGSKAHCLMLYKQGLIDKKDAQVILKALNRVENLWKKGDFVLDPSKEDVHTNIESWMIEKYGIDTVGKLHMGRSRNDQSALDIKLYLKDQALIFLKSNISLVKIFLGKAQEYQNVLMPGFTHHQHATPTSFGHMMMAFASMIIRDNNKFINWSKIHNLNPLGSVAAYGTTLPIDQKLTTEFLAFNDMEINSLDAITNKWEAESGLAFTIVTLMNHLSLIAQTLIIFSTPEFGFIELAEKYSTGSSIMPQKKNPDVLEVIKGKTSLAIGMLQGLLATGKDNFIGYNRHSQWSKYLIMDLIEECLPALTILNEIIDQGLIVHKEKMKYWSEKGFIGSTSLVEQLVMNYKIPFRKAKIIVETAIKYSSNKDKITYPSLLKALKTEKISLEIKKKDLAKWQDALWIIKNLKSVGGPGLKNMEKADKTITKELKFQGKFLNKEINKIKKGQYLLEKEINKLIKK